MVIIAGVGVPVCQILFAEEAGMKIANLFWLSWAGLLAAEIRPVWIYRILSEMILCVAKASSLFSSFVYL